MNFLFVLKLFGRASVQTTIAHNLGRITPAGWDTLEAAFGSASTAAIARSKGDLAAALTDVLFTIR